MTVNGDFKGLTTVALIGGGDLMVYAARTCLGHGVRVVAVLAPRHAGEALPVSGDNTKEAFEKIGVDVYVVDDINDWPQLETHDWTGPDSLALCFGPAWIFSLGVRSAFGHGMINFNGIPVPRYLGGAHYTWQILNDDRTGGCILQAITNDLDRGPVLRSAYFDLPEDIRTPQQYFEANHIKGLEFLEGAIGDMVAGNTFGFTDYDELDGQRLYFPRLFTQENAFIDWNWTAAEIERFCNAFDDPYTGARSFINGTQVCLKGVYLEEGVSHLHPFAVGLVVRRVGDTAWVSARMGLVRIGTVTTGDQCGMALLKEGRRLHTPIERLLHARTFRPVLGANGFSRTDED